MFLNYHSTNKPKKVGKLNATLGIELSKHIAHQNKAKTLRSVTRALPGTGTQRERERETASGTPQKALRRAQTRQA